MEQFEVEYKDTEERIAYLQEQQVSNAEKIEKLQERIEKTCCQAKFISSKNSAALHEFRNKMQDNAAASKERNRAICDLTRKRERIENEMKRNELEMQRLRKIRKTAK
ncbi:hypothetical protein STCU_04492 [Strigomonas culicis]|uniref:Uncharacterized protein n=1 Tax=Strigomonas culicis TaxID=28005 RepID=S9UL95_9TRYP|nr:hypothetical protein STCU_04492 [Strigomonas culicis]|eukprot:EPY29529.1 hypothetical protein STCU_04492 [Strigomonas culicis]